MAGDSRPQRRGDKRRMRQAQRRVAERRRRLPSDLAVDVPHSSPPTLEDMRGGVPSVVRGPAPQWVWRVGFFAAWTTAALAAVVSVGVATPVFGGTWDGWVLAAGAGVFAAASVLAGAASRHVSRRSVRVALGGAVVLAALYIWGAGSQVVIDGRPYLHTSETAQAWRLSQDLLGDMYRMGELDVLLGYDLVGARSNLRRYDPAAAELAQIAARWSTFEIAAVPDDRFIPVMRHVATSADFGAQAMRRKYELALQYDARAEAEAASWRATFVRELLSAGPLLAEISDHYGFDLVPREGGVAE